jgi:glutaredoxin
MKSCLSSALACLALCALASGASAEVYRWVDPATGQTRYSDTPPPGTVKNVARSGVRRATEKEGEDPQFSFAVREAARKFPVMLYTAPDSDFSTQARALLDKRSIPYRENVIRTDDDRKAMQNLTGNTKIPALYVGRQSVLGFDADAYHRALDLAGYPKTQEPAAANSSETP